MWIARGLAAMRVLACLLFLAAPGSAGLSRPAFAQPVAATGTLVLPLAQEKEESCGRGKATKEFGWKVVSFGVDTLKYLIGLFIIPVGFFLVVIGAMLQLVETVAC